MTIDDIQNKTVVCVFAHPDDESFGPGGTIALLSQKNTVYVLCATKGEEGENALGTTRENELLESSKVLGVKKVFFLGFQDGTLSNKLYHKLANAIKEKLDELKPEVLLTYEEHGVSGHIDHIVMSMVTNYLFPNLPYANILLEYCHDKEQKKRIRTIRKNYFVWFPDGYDPEDIGLEVDTNAVWPIRLKAIMKHQSQKKDIDWIMKIYETAPKRELFLVKEKR